ncbi:substrate-binding periplasmic protein [Shewanella gaetbuli]|uniref:Transporter substrate-binding domain-containing protein n=1 Tax=Shewanella gaetbuli TaxID=220752 RepID=A0A9X1ZUW8_9GAMM|nr:transporter substrate-binding domain-containing protein [Shewanella gaetbuli]MCL1142746.1 transporter substrate-binding domain-containing protein [Shewanella gaetbuli]
MRLSVKASYLITCILTLSFSAFSTANVITAHCRDYAPELSFDGEKCVGAIPDLVTDIFSELGYGIKWINAPWIRSIKEAKSGNVDLLIRHSMTKERELFLQPIVYGHYTRSLSFYKSPTLKGDAFSYDDISRYNIGAIRGNFYSPTFATLDTRILTLVSNTEQLIGMLELSRVDLVVTSHSHSERLFKDRFEKLTFVDTFDNPLYISIPTKSNIANVYPKVLEKMQEYRQNQAIDKYFKHYNLPVPKQLIE